MIVTLINDIISSESNRVIKQVSPPQQLYRTSQVFYPNKFLQNKSVM